MNIFKKSRPSLHNTAMRADVLQLTQQQVSHIIAFLLLFSFVIFIAGYYLGKRKALTSFADQLVNESVGDKVSYAFCAQYDSEEVGIEDYSENSSNVEPDKKYIAQLAGFGSMKMAQACMQKLMAKGYPVHVATRKSASAKGDVEKVWYQVVTQPYINKQELEQATEEMKKIARLQGIRIITLEKEQERQQS